MTNLKTWPTQRLIDMSLGLAQAYGDGRQVRTATTKNRWTSDSLTQLGSELAKGFSGGGVDGEF